MRFAKLEISMIVGMFVAAFDFDLVSKDGSKRAAPATDRNGTSPVRPKDRPFIKYKLRPNGLVA